MDAVHRLNVDGNMQLILLFLRNSRAYIEIYKINRVYRRHTNF